MIEVAQNAPLLAFSLPLPEKVFHAIPLFPGKIVFLALLGLSMISWAIILTRWLQLERVLRADAAFKKRLRSASTCLEVYEQGETFSWSPLYMTYKAGAVKAALNIAGNANPKFLADKQLLTEGGLDEIQLLVIEKAFKKSQENGLNRMSLGLKSLGTIAIIAAALGLLASCYFMVQALHSFERDFHQALFFSLAILIASILVTVPAGWLQLDFRKRYHALGNRYTWFRQQLLNTFRNSLQEKPQPEPVENELSTAPTPLVEIEKLKAIENSPPIETEEKVESIAVDEALQPFAEASEQETMATAAPQIAEQNPATPAEPVTPSEKAIEPAGTPATANIAPISSQQDVGFYQGSNTASTPAETPLPDPAAAASIKTLQAETRSLQEETKLLHEVTTSLFEVTGTLQDETIAIQSEAVAIQDETRSLQKETRSLQMITNTLKEESLPEEPPTRSQPEPIPVVAPYHHETTKADSVYAEEIVAPVTGPSAEEIQTHQEDAQALREAMNALQGVVQPDEPNDGNQRGDDDDFPGNRDFISLRDDD